MRTVAVNEAFLQKFGGSDGLLAEPLAYEAGHAVQDRDEVVRTVDASYEAHADALGLGLLRAIGMEPALGRVATEAWYGCAAVGKNSVGETHPGPQDRWVNHLLV